jgi:hypothetical protein
MTFSTGQCEAGSAPKGAAPAKRRQGGYWTRAGIGLIDAGAPSESLPAERKPKGEGAA